MRNQEEEPVQLRMYKKSFAIGKEPQIIKLYEKAKKARLMRNFIVESDLIDIGNQFYYRYIEEQEQFPMKLNKITSLDNKKHLLMIYRMWVVNKDQKQVRRIRKYEAIYKMLASLIQKQEKQERSFFKVFYDIKNSVGFMNIYEYRQITKWFRFDEKMTDKIEKINRQWEFWINGTEIENEEKKWLLN